MPFSHVFSVFENKILRNLNNYSFWFDLSNLSQIIWSFWFDSIWLVGANHVKFIFIYLIFFFISNYLFFNRLNSFLENKSKIQFGLKPIIKRPIRPSLHTHKTSNQIQAHFIELATPFVVKSQFYQLKSMSNEEKYVF